MKKYLIVLAFLPSLALAQKVSFEPIRGDDMAVAKKVIFVDAEQPCGKVVSAKRDGKGMLTAACSNGEKYLVAMLKNAPMNDGTRKNVPIALKCSLAKSTFNIECPN